MQDPAGRRRRRRRRVRRHRRAPRLLRDDRGRRLRPRPRPRRPRPIDDRFVAAQVDASDADVGGRAVPRARHHARDERRRPASSSCRSSTGAFAAGADYLDMAMSLSQPHPEAPYEKTGVKLGDEQFAQARRVGGGRPARAGRASASSRASPTCSRGTPPTTCSPRSTSSAPATAPTSSSPTTTATTSRRRSRSGPRSRSASTRR